MSPRLLFYALAAYAAWRFLRKKEAAPATFETVQFEMAREPLPDVELETEWPPEVVQSVVAAKASCREENVGAPVQKVAECAAKRVFPQFPWPPVHGDHPSAWEVWARFVAPEEKGAGPDPKLVG